MYNGIVSINVVKGLTSYCDVKMILPLFYRTCQWLNALGAYFFNWIKHVFSLYGEIEPEEKGKKANTQTRKGKTAAIHLDFCNAKENGRNKVFIQVWQGLQLRALN